jgi:DNA-binding IclR family transcriptional regulator
MTHDRGSTFKRVLDVLDGLARAEKPVTPAELNADLGLATATVYRLCKMLESEGYLQRQLDGRRYVPGPRLTRIAWGVIANASFRAKRHVILDALAAKIGETCNIAVPVDTEMVYIDRVESHWPLQIHLPIGSRIPTYCSASGKLYLSLLPDEKRKTLLSHLRLEPRTPFTITDPQVLEEDLRGIRADEVGREMEEYATGMLSVAVPIKGRKGDLQATLSIHAPLARMNMDAALSKVPELRKAASEFSLLVSPDNP